MKDQNQEYKRGGVYSVRPEYQKNSVDEKQIGITQAKNDNFSYGVSIQTKDLTSKSVNFDIFSKRRANRAANKQVMDNMLSPLIDDQKNTFTEVKQYPQS